MNTKRLRLITHYPKERFLNSKIEARIQGKRLFVTLGYNDMRPGYVPLERVVGIVEEIEYDDDSGGFFVGYVTMNSPCGRLVRELEEQDVNLIIRPNGHGTVINGVVQEDYELTHFYLAAE